MAAPNGQARWNFAWDRNDVSGDRGYGTAATTLEDERGMRRREFGFSVKKKGVYDAMVYYDFESDTWLDVFVRLDSAAWSERDLGRVRAGYLKTPVGLEGNTSSRAGSLMENSAATQAMFEGRRAGLEWAFDRPVGGGSIAYYFGKDLQGDNPGTTAAARAYWTPLRMERATIHLGVAGSVENPRGHTDGRDVFTPASARFRARPQAGLTGIRLVDSGRIADVGRIDRLGLETLWISGPWSLQGEYLRADAHRAPATGAPDYSASGWYVMGGLIATGETRPYRGGNVANPLPSRRAGAVEVLLRYGELDLDDDAIAGGRQRDLTLGANWYLTSHFKFQANYARVRDERGASASNTDVVALRAQLQF